MEHNTTLAADSIDVPQSEIRRRILNMVWPATVENVLQMLVGIVATGMVGKISAEAVAAVGLSTRITQIVWGIFSAIGTGATVLIARSFGANNRGAAKRTAEQAMLLAIGLVTVMTIVIWTKARFWLVLLFNTEGQLLQSAYVFLRLAVWGMPFMAVMQVVGAIMRGAGNTKTPMQIAFIVNVINVIANYVLIYGIFGSPALGMQGAAIAMLISQMIGAVLALYAITQPLASVQLNLRQKIATDLQEMRRILGVGIPAAFEHLFWQFATIIMMGLIVTFGTNALAAHQLGLNAESLSYMPSAGFGIAATAFVGQSLGAGRLDLARRYVKEINKWGIALTVVTGGMLLLIPTQIMSLLTNDVEVIELGAIYLRLMGSVQIPQLISGILNGAMRGGGDTKAPMYIGGIGLWGIRIPFSFILGQHFGLGILGVWLSMTLDLSVRFLLTLLRYRSGKWKNTLASDAAVMEMSAN